MSNTYESSSEEPFTVKISGTPEVVQYVLHETAGRVGREQGNRYSLDEVKHNYGPALSVRVANDLGSGPIGVIFVFAASDHDTILRVPPTNPASYNKHDSGGQLFSQFLNAALVELQRMGVVSNRSKFTSTVSLVNAERRLASAQESQDYADIGNSCRAALIELANEIYKPHMLPQGDEEPKNGDSAQKLKYAAKHYCTIGNRGTSAYTKVISGIEQVVQGARDYQQPLTHAPSASRAEAELGLLLTQMIFDSFALLVPNA